MKRILRFLAVFGMFVVGTNAWSAGYVCDTMMVYDSCASGYYVSDCGDSADWSGKTLTESDLSVGNTCVACPDGYNCAGQLVCPVSTGAGGGDGGDDNGGSDDNDGGDDDGGSDESAEDIPYACSMERSYSSCTSNYYLSDCGTSSNWKGQTLDTSDLSVGNSCEPCPEDGVCSGGTTCPIIPDYKFELKTVAGTSSFDININAAGNFVIDWDDGNVEAVINETTTYKNVSHTYATAGEYTIKMGGLATEYNVEAITENDVPVVGFSTTKIASIDGSIGAIFPTLSNGDQPGFFSTFANSKITSLPSTLFNGIHGAGESMFTETFSGCEALTEIPAELFSGITGAADHMFNGTFWGCTGLTEIPAGLFDGLADVETLSNNMFDYTFKGCSALTGPAAKMSAAKGGKYLHEIWPMTGSDMQTYTDATGLDGWNYIPKSWGGGGLVNCDAGTYLPANATACEPCLVGNYCAGLTGVVPSDANQGIEPCEPGTYQDLTGQSTCNICAPLEEVFASSALGSTYQEACYIPKETLVDDGAGKYKYTMDCYYSEEE